MSDKTELLAEYEGYINRRKKLDFTYFVVLFLTLTFIIMFAFPKVYITQQIYYKSRDIAKLKHEYDVLKEENKIISAAVEEIKFKNQILDTLF